MNVVLDIADPLPHAPCLQSDLEQVILNLVSNARDAMSDGGELRITADQHDSSLRIIVRDTGCGIEPQHLDKIQEPFFTTKSNGTGLGLSICRSIVWENRGKILFDSAAGRGTTVTVLLPI